MIAPCTPTEGMADLLFGMFDAEHSGTLSFDALVKALAIMIKGEREDKIELCFRLLDTDMDGEIHRSGIINLMGNLHRYIIYADTVSISMDNTRGKASVVKAKCLSPQFVDVHVVHVVCCVSINRTQDCLRAYAKHVKKPGCGSYQHN